MQADKKRPGRGYHRPVDVGPERRKQILYRISQDESIDAKDRIAALTEFRLLEEQERSNQTTPDTASAFTVSLEEAQKAEERLARLKAEQARRELLEKAQVLGGSPEDVRQDARVSIIMDSVGAEPKPIHVGTGALQPRIATEGKLSDSEKATERQDWVSKQLRVNGEVGGSYSRYSDDQRRVQ